MQRIVDETFRRGRFVTLSAAACLLSLASACTGRDQAPTGPRALSEPTPPALDLEPSGLTLFGAYSFLPFTPDVQGANDYSGQNDVNQMTRADNNGLFGVAWTWDETDAWTGAGQTGDVCALFDTDATGPGNANYALCVRITNPGGNPNEVAQTSDSPILYECSDKKTDRCTTTVIPRSLGSTFCEVVTTTTDAFPGVGADGADVLAACAIDLSAIGTPASVKFLNVCSFPSGSPNSNPFDCILVAGSGYLKIVKKTTPDNQQPTNTFSFLLKSGTQDAGVTHQVADDEAGDDESALIPLDPNKTYSLEEINFPTGWALGTATCAGSSENVQQDGNKLTNIKTTVGGTVTCTFNNAQNGSITIVKNAEPNAAQDFAFTTSGLSSFSLDDDSDPELSNTKAFTALAAGSYSVTETDAAGWKVTNIVCTGKTNSTVTIGAAGTYDDGDKAVSITLAAGENITCTFDNTKLGKITIVKDAVPDNDQDFDYTTTGLSGATFTLDDFAGSAGTPNSQVFSGLLAGVRRITETGVGGWSITSISCTGNTASGVTTGADYVEVDLKDGEEVSCTFVNTKHGSITIVKNAVPDHGEEFSYTTTNLTPATFTLVDDGSDTPPVKSRTFSGLLPGTYSVAEGSESGWALTNINCGGASSATIGASSVSIALTAGENVTCTFENTQGGSITVIKDALPDDPQDFAFTGSGVGIATTFSLDDDGDETNALKRSVTFSGLQPGQRTISETLNPSWGKLTNITCDANVSGADDEFDAGDNSITIDLLAGQNVTCTFQNTKSGQITIVKDAVPNALQDFAFSGNITGCTSFTLDDDAGVTGADNTNSNQIVCTVDPGTFHVDETVPAGWTKTSATCSDTSPITAIAVAPGENVTCTFVNSVVTPTIKVTKTASPGTFSAVVGELPEGFAAKDTFRVNPNQPPAGTPNFASATCDDKGPNDINSAQVDLNCFNRADNVNNRIFVQWTWDSIDEWGGGGSTGDACALLDTDGDGNINLAVCARIQNAANGSIVQVGGDNAADVYTCNDTKPDRCAKQVTTLTTAQKLATKCQVETITPDGFPGQGEDGADVQATCEIDRGMLVNEVPIPATTELVNVCSFPSGEPNSNPFDCVVTIGSGFIQIVKATNLTTSTLFGFTLGTNEAGSPTRNYIIQGAVASALIPVAPTSGTTRYTLAEAITTNWTLAGATCVDGAESRGTFNSTARGFTNIVVKSGQTTVCTFTNDGQYSTVVRFKIEVENKGTVNANLTYLDDSYFHAVASIAECSALGTLLPGPTNKYSCTFDRTMTGLPNATHSNTVTARAKDVPTGSITVEDTATAGFSFPAPPPP